MTALQLTAIDLSTAIRSATFGSVPPVRWVEDMDTRERVGWMRRHGNTIEWATDNAGGFAGTEDEALARIEREVLNLRKIREDQARWEQAINALPEPLRHARVEMEHAAMRLEIERRRNIQRPEALALAQRAYDAARAEYWRAQDDAASHADRINDERREGARS